MDTTSEERYTLPVTQEPVQSEHTLLAELGVQNLKVCSMKVAQMAEAEV